jgi:phosphopantetheine--protein transferase-like protein
VSTTGPSGSSGPDAAVVGVGVDAVDLDRFRVVVGRWGRLGRRGFVLGRWRRSAGRVVTERERADARACADPIPRLAARFAAKEAVMKALGVGLGAFALAEVEVVRDPSGSPSLVLHGSAADRARAAGVARWHLSLTHSGLVALAMVVAAGGAGASAAS